MTRSKIDSRLYSTSLPVTLLLFLCAFFTIDLTAQDKIDLRFTAAATAGYAPVVTYGSNEYSGVVVGFYGELEYGEVIGRLQFTKPLLSTFQENNNLDSGEAYHGSLGYRFDFSEKFSAGLLVSGGATVIHYRNGIFGSRGDEFTNVSPQVGINIMPTYQINDPLSIQAGLRYYKGFEAGDRGRASDLADFSIALRFSL